VSSFQAFCSESRRSALLWRESDRHKKKTGLPFPNWAYNNDVMRRLMAIAAFALLLTVPLWSQRGGGGHGGGFGGGHPGGFAGHGFAGHSSGFAHSGFGQSGFRGGRAPIGSFPRPLGGPARVTGFRRAPMSSTFGFGFRSNRFHNFGNFGFRNCFGRGCRGYGYPWWGWGWDPWLWDSGYDNYDEDYERDRAIAEQMNAQNIEEQRMLRQEEMDGDRDAYARPSHPRQEHAQEQQSEGAAVLPPTVLVFRDQHKVEVQNYAIVGQTLWAFAPQHQKIPLSDLDLQATVKANEDRGVTFSVPGTKEGM
jgi:hypothetical protein